MDDDRGLRDEREEPAPRSGGDWKQLLSTGILLAAVLAILAAGAVLRAERNVAAPPRAAVALPARAANDDEAPAASPPARPVPAPQPATEPPATPRLPAPPAAAPANDLGKRASRDLDRLSREHGKFTAQVAVTCKPDNTRRVLHMAGGSERLFVVPLPDRGPSCYRVCWGLYPSAKEAAAAADLPAFLRRGGGKPAAKPVAEIAP